MQEKIYYFMMEAAPGEGSEEAGEYVSRNQSSLPKLAQPRRFEQVLKRTILVKAFHVPKLLQLIKWRQLTYPL